MVSSISVSCFDDGALVERRFRTDLDIEGIIHVLEGDLAGDGVQLVWVDEAVNDEHQLGERS